MEGDSGNNFWQNHWKFMFVTLSQEIPDKMKLHPWNFQNLCYTPWKFQCLYLRLVEIPHDFFLFTPVNSFSWHPLEFPQFFQKFHVLFFLKFSEKLVQTVTPTVIYISSFWWVVNILLQKFYTLSKKETLTQKAAFLSFTAKSLHWPVM